MAVAGVTHPEARSQPQNGEISGYGKEEFISKISETNIRPYDVIPGIPIALATYLVQAEEGGPLVTLEENVSELWKKSRINLPHPPLFLYKDDHFFKLLGLNYIYWLATEEITRKVKDGDGPIREEKLRLSIDDKAGFLVRAESAILTEMHLAGREIDELFGEHVRGLYEHIEAHFQSRRFADARLGKALKWLLSVEILNLDNEVNRNQGRSAQWRSTEMPKVRINDRSFVRLPVGVIPYQVEPEGIGAKTVWDFGRAEIKSPMDMIGVHQYEDYVWGDVRELIPPEYWGKVIFSKDHRVVPDEKRQYYLNIEEQYYWALVDNILAKEPVQAPMI